VVLITALQDSRDRIRGLEVGADDFISKPLNPAELTARVRSLLRLKRYTDELDTAESVILSLALTIRSARRDNGRPLSAAGALRGHAWKRAQARGQRACGARARGFLHDIGKVGIPDAVLMKPAA